MKGWLLFCVCCQPLQWAYAEENNECQTAVQNEPAAINTLPLKVEQLHIITHPIFDLNDPDTIWLHRFANWLHIETKPRVIAERLPFSEGDVVSSTDLAEAERIVRRLPYVRDSRVHTVVGCQADAPLIVEVESWDNWSLIPTISFGRKGGENKGSIGIKEDNLLGLGIRTRFKYNSDNQRTGYQFTMQSATPYLMPFSSMLFDYLDNDDGNLLNVEFTRPFYHARTERMYFASYLTDQKEVDIYQNGGIRNSFANDSHRYEIATGWQVNSTLLMSKRIKVGLVDEEALFMPSINKPFDFASLPQGRRNQYVWVGFEALQRDYRIMTDIYLIQQAEDINLGWHYEAKLGLDFANNPGQQGIGYHLDLSLNKGWEVNDGLLLLSGIGQGVFNQGHPDHVRLSASAEYFKRYSQLLGFYSRLSAASEKNPFLDMPETIGDESGVRGYPLQYQHGDHSFSGSIEARLYTGYNIYKLLDVGFAGFVDVGRAWGGEQGKLNESEQILSSVGVGVRLYSNRSSHQSVIHIDIVKPMVSSDNVDSWEWRLQVKQSF